jgi:hypothetical protein
MSLALIGLSALSEWNFNFGVTAWHGSVHRGGNLFKMQPDA